MTSLPHTRLKDLRVASLVYNDAHNDARVLKAARSLADNGAEVEIVAVAREAQGHPAGKESRGNHVVINRVPAFTLDQIAGPLAPQLRKRLGFGAPGTSMRTPGNAGQPNRPPARVVSTRAQKKSPTSQASRALLRFARKAAVSAWGPVSLAYYWVGATRTLLSEDNDVVLANDANTLVPALILRALKGTNFVYDSHELWRRRNVPKRRIAPYVEAAIERVGITRASRVMTVSPSIAEWLKRAYNLDELPALVRNIPSEAPVPDRSEGRLHDLAGLSSDIPIISYGGGITTSRGIEETIDALALMDPNVHLVMLGYGAEDYIESLHQRAKKRGVAHRIHVVGPVAPDEVTSALADGDVAVVHIRPTCLSYRFALPNKLFESIRAGLPVVAADLPDLAAIIRELGVGRTVALEDPSSLADALTAVLRDGDAFRAAAREAAPNLTWEREVEALIEGIQEAAQ